MSVRSESETKPMKNRTNVERKSDLELVVERTVNGPVHLVYEAWSKPELFKQWWVPKSAALSLVSFEQDVRVGGTYRLVFSVQGAEMAFFGTYREVVPNTRIVWTNEEAGDEGQISTVTFEEKAGKTLVVMHELYPTKAALDAALASGSQEGTCETFDQLDEFIVARAASSASK
jgi:uncharacterized protein YndB with AHSA1/START domain